MKPSKPLMLEVPDAEERDDFLANAREVWNRSHPEKHKEPGRHGDKRIIAVLREVLVSLPRKPFPSKRKVKKLVEEKFHTESYMAEKFPDDLQPASGDAIYRYVKLALILMKWAKEDGVTFPLLLHQS